MAIKKVTEYTGDVADPYGSQSQAEFTQNAFDQFGYLKGFSPDLNSTIDDMNTAIVSVEQSEVSAAASAAAAEAAALGGGYKGLWPDTGGSATKGDVWQTQAVGTPTGEYFVALQNTTADPIEDNVNWRVSANLSASNLSNYTDLTFDSVEDLKLATKVNQSSIDIGDIQAKTTSYYGGWAALLIPVGGAEYVLTTRQRVRDTLGDALWEPDGFGDHYLFGGTDYVAMLRNGSTTNPLKYGAKGIGSAHDDTNAVSAALDSGLEVVAPLGFDFNITSTIEKTSSNRYSMSGDGFYSTSATDLPLMFDFKDGVEYLNFKSSIRSGDGKVVRGLRVSCDADIECNISGLGSILASSTSSIGVIVDLPLSKGIEVKIHDSDISDITAWIGGAIGESAGAARSVYITRATGTQTGSHSVEIVGNTFKNIFGREGDIIQIQDNNLSDRKAKYKLKGNTIAYSNRRHIKLVCNDCEISENTHITIDPDSPFYALDGEGGAGVIGIISGGEGVTITDETIYNNSGIKNAIYATDASANPKVKGLKHYIPSYNAAWPPVGVATTTNDTFLLSDSYIETTGEPVSAIASTEIFIDRNEFVLIGDQFVRQFILISQNLQGGRVGRNEFSAKDNTNVLSLVRNSDTNANYSSVLEIVKNNGDVPNSLSAVFRLNSTTVNNLVCVDNWLSNGKKPFDSTGSTITNSFFLRNSSSLYPDDVPS